MEHIKFLLSVIIVASGLYVTSYINSLRKKFRFIYLSRLAVYMLIVTFLFSILMFAIYFKLNLPGEFLFNRPSSTGNMVGLVIYVLFFSLIFQMFLIVADMLRIQPGIRYKAPVFLCLIFALGMEWIHVFHPEILRGNGVLLFVYDNFVDNFLFLEVILLVFLILRGRKRADGAERKMVVSFGYVFIFRYVLLVAGYFVFAGSGYSKYMVFFVQALILFSVIILPYLWVRIWFQKYAKGLSGEDELRARLDSVCRTYGISEREREIIRMILRGMTNKEIEDELFISINTVKNHVYNIFKKLKINSRHQLVKFFTGI